MENDQMLSDAFADLATDLNTLKALIAFKHDVVLEKHATNLEQIRQDAVRVMVKLDRFDAPSEGDIQRAINHPHDVNAMVVSCWARTPKSDLYPGIANRLHGHAEAIGRYLTPSWGYDAEYTKPAHEIHDALLIIANDLRKVAAMEPSTSTCHQPSPVSAPLSATKEQPEMDTFDTVSNIVRALDIVRTVPDLFLQVPEGAAEVQLNEARDEAVRLCSIYSTPYGTGYDERTTRCVLAREYSGIRTSTDVKKAKAEVKKAGGLAEQFQALTVTIDQLMASPQRQETRPCNPINVRLLKLRDTLNELAQTVQQASASAA